jgi:hypothetical protein
MYVSPLSSVVSAHGINRHQYADDIQLHAALQAIGHTELSHIVQCAASVSRWLLENRLLLNPAKTEVVGFGIALSSTSRLKKISRLRNN